MIQNYRSRGFTLIELMLAVTFISILLISIVGVVMQIASVYNKGLVVKAVNQASITVADDMKRVISQSKALDLSSSDTYYTDRYLGITRGGRLCTGVYTYAWNISNSRISSPYNIYLALSPQNPIRIVRFKDVNGDFCKAPKRNDPIPNNGTVELFKDEFLKIQNFEIKQKAFDSNSRSALYQIIITASSGDKSEINDTNPSESKCYDPNDTRSNNDFCAVNQIKFTALAGKMEVQL